MVAPLLLARIMVWTADGAVLVWGAPAIARRFELTPDRVGAILATSLLVGGVLGPLLGGPLADICQRSGGPRRTVTALAGLSLLCTPAALFAATPTATLAGIALTVFLTLGFILGVAATALATIVVPSELRGLFLAIQVTAAALFCFGVAPLVVSGISGVLGGPDSIGQALALVCSVTSFVAFIVLLLARRGFPRTSHPTAAATPLARLPV